MDGTDHRRRDTEDDAGTDNFRCINAISSRRWRRNILVTIDSLALLLLIALYLSLFPFLDCFLSANISSIDQAIAQILPQAPVNTPITTTQPPKMPQCLNPHDPNANFLYCPSTGAAVTFSVLFALTLTAHIAQAFIYKKRFCWVIIMATLWETTGFILRVLATQHQASVGFATPSQLLILLAPLWINAFAYMILGRMIHFYLPDQKVWRIKAKRLTLIFVLLDFGSFIVQGIGGSMLSGHESNSAMMLGIHIYMAGIGVQEFFIVVFIALAIQFQRKVTRIDGAWRGESWRPLLYTLYALLLLITTRIIYRLVELSGGVYTALPMHEEYFYILEATPMFIACLTLNIWHPGRFLVGPESEFLQKTKEQKKAAKEAKKEAKRVKKQAKLDEKESKKQEKLDVKQEKRERKEAGREATELKKTGKGGWWKRNANKTTDVEFGLRDTEGLL